MSQPVTAESVLLVAVMTLTGLFLVWLGRHVKRTEDTTLVAGARGATITDPAGLTTLVGTVTMATGVVTVLVGLVHPLLPSPYPGLLWGGYIVVTLALAGWAHWRSKLYTE